MRAVFASVLILLLVLTAVILPAYFLPRRLRSLSEAVASLSSDRTDIPQSLDKLYQAWERLCRYLTVLYSDQQLEQISELFCRLYAEAASQRDAEFRLTQALLLRRLEALHQGQRLTLHGLF